MKTRVLIASFAISLCLIPFHLQSQTVLSGNITVDTDLGPNGSPADSVYIINGTLRVYGTDGSDGVTTLSVESGVKIKFTKSASSILQIGEGSSPGSLKVEGSE